MNILKNICGILYTLILVSCVGYKETPLKFESSVSSGKTVVTKAQSIEAFKQTVYPVVRSMSCVECHGDSKKYQPYYAVSDVTQAWDSILNISKKVNLDAPESSRMYLRIKVDHHNCLKGAGDLNCDEEASTMLAAIKRWKELTTVVGENSALKTDALIYKSTALSLPEADYGTILFEAEQVDFPEAMIGRFVADSDGKASGFKYASTQLPALNPSTGAIRTPSIVKGGNACEVTTPAMLTNSVTGPYRVKEESTHINSGKVTSKNLIIKDGHRPFSIAISSLIIRPDKRMNYAKMLTGWKLGSGASGVSDFSVTNFFALTDGNFDVEGLNVSGSTRVKEAIDVTSLSLLGVALNDVSFKTLPHFMSRSSVFEFSNSTAYINDPNRSITNHLGNTLLLKNLFKLPMNELTPKDVLTFFENNSYVETDKINFRRDLMFRFVDQKLNAFANSQNKYAKIKNFTRDHFYSLYGNLKLNIKACDVVCTASSQEVEVTPYTDNDGVILTKDNLSDILKVNEAGDGFTVGTIDELKAGKAFRRIDVYVHHNMQPDALKYGDAFAQNFYMPDNSEKEIYFPLIKPAEDLDLRAMYLNGVNSLTREESIKNFQTSLYPVLQKSSCIGCHSGNTALRVQFASSNPIISFNEIEKLKLVNFGTPASSFRKVIYPGDATIGHNCGNGDINCSKAQNEFIAGIDQWRLANNASAAANSSQPYQELSEAERTPGMLTYKFKINKTGYYNIWTKVKASNQFAINLRVLDGSTAISAFKKIITPAKEANSCVKFTFPELTDWTWYTPGRETDLSKLNSLGSLKKNNAGQLLSLDDNRFYWMMEAGKTYTLQVFEAAAQTKIDMIAIDYVANHRDLLDFQPDLLARDENNISDYQKRILNYDISKLVGLEPGSAFFKVEVKAALDGQGYIFRNPRISSPTSITAKKIRVFVNGTSSFSDATWNNIDIVAGDDQVITFAPLIALTKFSPDTDFFQFTFEKLEQTNKIISELDPRGSAPRLVEGRKCRELDLFLETVKPILRNARLMLKDNDGINEYLRTYPGSNRNRLNPPNLYQCMTCHNDTHPYFKMTTFDYPEILCAQALSRVDFSNYRESLLVRGLDGSGVHPKLHFVEELQYAADAKSVIAYNPNDGTRILSGQFNNQFSSTTPGYFSKWLPNYYFEYYSQEDLGLNSTWGNNSEAKKELARNYLGQFKRIDYNLIPDLSSKTYYEAFIHDILKDKIQTENDNLTSGVLVVNSINSYHHFIPSPTDLLNTVNRKSISLIVKKDGNNKIIKDGIGKYDLNTNLSADQMNDKVEDLKAKYRNVIIDWIEKEHAHIKNDK